MSIPYGVENNPTTLQGSIGGEQYAISRLERLLPALVTNQAVAVYDNALDFRPAVERVSVLAQRPNEPNPGKTVVMFNSRIWVPSTQPVVGHLENALITRLSVKNSPHLILETPYELINMREKNKYVVMQDRERAIGTVEAGIVSKGLVRITSGRWVRGEKDELIHDFPEEDFRNLPAIIHRLKAVMDVSSFVVDLLRNYYLEQDDLPPWSDEAPEKSTQDTSSEQRSNLRENITIKSPEKTEESPKILLKDIGGLEEIKQVFEEIIAFSKRPGAVSKWGVKRPKSVLLYGPPGTGKGMLAEAFANELGAELQKVRPDDINDPWHGGSEANMRRVFRGAVEASKKGPLVLFFDEIDGTISIQGRPGAGGGDAARNAVAAIFKQEMNTIADNNPNLYVIAATNDKDRLDPALIRSGRFNYQLYVPLPDELGRRQIFANYIVDMISMAEATGRDTIATDIDIFGAAQKTDGMSGADIAEIMRRITQRKAREELKNGNAAPICNEDIIAEIKFYRTHG